MGSRISVDKHTSRLEDILDLNPKLLEKVKFESNIPDCITQHLKIWKFSDDNQELRKVKSDPINMSQIQSSGFNFLSNECYLVLLVYRKSHQDNNMFLSFPHQMWGTVESHSNLTPRGLESPVAGSDKEIFDSFLLPKRSECNQSEFEYMIFVWNGKTANALVKAQALSNAFELENLLNKGKDSLLQILFSGGVIRNKKLQKGSIMQLQSQAESPINIEYLEQEQHARETVYLFNFLFPQPVQTLEKKREFSKLSDFLQQKSTFSNSIQNYNSRFRVAKATEIDNQEQKRVLHFQGPAETENSDQQSEQQLSSYRQDYVQEEEVHQRTMGKVPSLNFKQLTFQQEKQRIIPKFDLNLKNVSHDLSHQPSSARMELDIGVPLVEGVEYSDLKQEQKNNTSKRLQLGQLNQRDCTYQDIADEEQSGFNFDIRDTDRKKLKIKYFSDICSEVVKDVLFVGGESIAHNKEVLVELGVTHVINCAGEICINKFTDQFNYITYYLKDSKTEVNIQQNNLQQNIECIFYEVIQTIEDVILSGGKVLVHCQQGVSRSISLCIAYLIYIQKLSYSAAFDHIKQVRGVASPNIGFTVQLLLFQKRLQCAYDNIPVNPRVFAVSRGVQGNNDVVCRMLIDQLYAGKSVRTLDSRGVFLIQSENEIYIWMGPECQGDRQQLSLCYALYYSNLLKLHESAPQMDPILLSANEEPQKFWNLWGFQNDRPQILCQRIKEWDPWYQVIDEEQFQIEKLQIQQEYRRDIVEVELVKEPIREISPQTTIRPLLFVHPNTEEPLGIFDLEDLDQQNLCMLLKLHDDVLQVFIWRGAQWIGNDDEERNYVDEIIHTNYRSFSHESIFIYKEEPNGESDEFLDCFQ